MYVGSKVYKENCKMNAKTHRHPHLSHMTGSLINKLHEPITAAHLNVFALRGHVKVCLLLPNVFTSQSGARGKSNCMLTFC